MGGSPKLGWEKAGIPIKHWGWATRAEKASYRETAVQNTKMDSNMFSMNFKVLDVLRANLKGGREENGLSKNILWDECFPAQRLPRSFGAFRNMEAYAVVLLGPVLCNAPAHYNTVLQSQRPVVQMVIGHTEGVFFGARPCAALLNRNPAMARGAPELFKSRSVSTISFS